MARRDRQRKSFIGAVYPLRKFMGHGDYANYKLLDWDKRFKTLTVERSREDKEKLFLEFYNALFSRRLSPFEVGKLKTHILLMRQELKKLEFSS